MEQIINTTASGLGNGIGWLAEHGVLFAIFLIGWLGFGVALVASQTSLDQAWQAIRDLPILLQAIVWLLFLPIVAGLWIWETTWPFVLRVLLVASLAGWNLLVFLPRAAESTAR